MTEPRSHSQNARTCTAYEIIILNHMRAHVAFIVNVFLTHSVSSHPIVPLNLYLRAPNVSGSILLIVRLHRLNLNCLNMERTSHPLPSALL